MKTLQKNDIPKVINPIMDIYQKGFMTGMDVGKELVIDKVYEWLENYAELTGIDSEVIKESFRKAMEE